MNVYPSKVKFDFDDQEATRLFRPRSERKTHSDISASFEDMPHILALHPNPAYSLGQLLTQVIQILNEFNRSSRNARIFGPVIRANITSLAAAKRICEIEDIRAVECLYRCAPLVDRQRASIGGDSLLAGSRFNGEGEIVFIADTGFDKGRTDDVHPAFTGRVLAAATSSGSDIKADWRGHGTHVAGSLLGDFTRLPGRSLHSRGIAPDAKLVSISVNFESMPPISELLTQEVGPYGIPIVMNNSWGRSPRKRRALQAKWQDVAEGAVDRVMYNNPSTCLVFAAGNDGELAYPAIDYCAAAKNCITVGATSYDEPPDPIRGNLNRAGISPAFHKVASLSSSGPTITGRLAPDVVAPGVAVESARSRAIFCAELQNFGLSIHDDMMVSSGTSMSAPVVTGLAAVLRSILVRQRGIHPTGALLKALTIHGAVDLVGTTQNLWDSRTGAIHAVTMTAAPNPFQGYGLVNVSASLSPILADASNDSGFSDASFSSGRDQVVRTISVSKGTRKIVVTLAYTDPPAAEVQNLLDLEVIFSDSSRIGPSAPTDPLHRHFAWKRSNVAKIVVEDPPEGVARILLSVETLEPDAKFAIVWELF